jgi:hypothetical protein
MSDIRWFRLSLVAIGLFFVVMGSPNGLYYIAVFLYYVLNSNADMYGYPTSSYLFSAVPGFIQCGLGLVLIVKSASISRYFASRSIGRCHACNYDISGVPERGTCPECGEQIDHKAIAVAQVNQPTSTFD